MSRVVARVRRSGRAVASLMLLGAFWGLGVATSSSWAAPAARSLSPAQVGESIAQLADPDFAVREQATQALWEAGRSAEGALREALAEGGHPEIISRAKLILGDFRYGIYPDTPMELLPLLRKYRAGPAYEKRQVVDSLGELGRVAWPYLARLAAAEEDIALRNDIFRSVSERAFEIAPACLAERDFVTAQQLLELSLASGGAATARAYAAFVVLRGSTDAAAARLAEKAKQEDLGSARILAQVYRASDDHAKSLEAALLAQEPAGIRDALIAQADWRGLAEHLQKTDANTSDPAAGGLLAAAQRLSGDPAMASATLDRVRRSAEQAPTAAWPAARVLLLNGRANDAIELCIKANKPVEAFELLSAQQRFDEAMVLARKAVAEGHVDGMRLRIAMGRTLAQLGDSAEANRWHDEVVTALARRWDRELYQRLILAEVEAGSTDRAVEHTAAAIAGMGPGQPAGWALAALFPARPLEAERWYRFLRDEHSGEAPAQTLKRVREVLEGAMPPDALDRLARRAYQSQTESVLRTICQTLLDLGREEAARDLLAKLMKLPESPAASIMLGTMAARQGDWKVAAAHYGRSAEKQPTAIACTLYGQAMMRLGEATAARPWLELGTLLPLANELRRIELAEAIEEAGLPEAAIEQYRLAVRLGDPRSGGVASAIRRVAEAETEAEHFDRAADLWERIALECMGPNAYFEETAAYLSVPQFVARKRAVALAAANRFDEAMAMTELCLRNMPGDISVALDLAAPLRKTGHAADAERLIDRLVQAHQPLLERYPRSAHLHNNVAWLLVRTGQRLDDALRHAAAAAELEPRSTAVLDTLAEVHFQRGETEKAMALMKQCMALEPWVERHQKAMARFETGDKTKPPPQ